MQRLLQNRCLGVGLGYMADLQLHRMPFRTGHHLALIGLAVKKSTVERPSKNAGKREGEFPPEDLAIHIHISLLYEECLIIRRHL